MMKVIHRIALGAGAALAALLGGCVGPVQAPPPAAPPPRPIAPTPSRLAPTDWHDMPVTPGVWQWRREGRLSVARFMTPPNPTLFSLSCDPQAGTIDFVRDDLAGRAATMTILTTSLSRRIPGGSARDLASTPSLSARDPLLDAMAFSRGRFAVEAPGMVSLYLPSWPEVSRVIEDCRARP